MKRNFMILAVCFACTAVNAQNRSIVFENTKKQNAGNFSEVKMPVNGYITTLDDAIIPEAFSMPCGLFPDSLKTYDDGEFWITGTNGYGDLAFGYLFNGTEGGTVSSLKAYLLKGYEGGVDTVIFAKLYSVGEDGLPAELLGTSDPFPTNTLVPWEIAEYTFNFATAVTVPTDFIAAITVPAWTENSIDVVIATSPMGCYAAGTESYPVSYSNVDGMGTMGWIAMNKSWLTEPDGIFDLAIFPVLQSAGTSKNSIGYNLLVTPNPTNGELVITGNNLQADKISVYDGFGRMVESVQCSLSVDGTININISHLPDGIYYLRTKNGTATVVKQ